MNKNIDGYDKKMTDGLGNILPNDPDYYLRHDTPIGIIKNKIETNEKTLNILLSLPQYERDRIYKLFGV